MEVADRDWRKPFWFRDLRGWKEDNRAEEPYFWDKGKGLWPGPWKAEGLTYLKMWLRESNRQARTDMSIS